MNALVDRNDALALRDVGRTFDGARPVTALRHATFCVERGEMIAMVGRSGSGKSTLLNIVGLLDRPTHGTYCVDGVDVAQLSESQATALRSSYFGFVFQKAHLVPHRTARENVEIALIPRGLRPRERRNRASTILDEVGLDHRREAFPETLSGGEAQRVAVARAIAQEPRVLLCDEPTGNLDRRTGQQVMNLFEQLNADGLIVIIATHDEEIAARMGRRLVVADGVVEDQGSAPC